MHRPATGVLALTAIGTPANARGSPAADRVRLRQRPLRVELDERAELRIERLDPPDTGLDHLAGRDGAVPDARGDLGRRQEGERVHEVSTLTIPSGAQAAARP